MKNILLKIREDLRNNIDEKTRTSSQRFFKEKIKSYGVKAPTVNKICKDNSKLIEPLKKTDIFNLCELLWQSGYLEESLIACNWSYALHKQYEPNDFQYFEKWIDNYVNNWASCDTLCNHTVGVFLVMYPEYLSRIKIMAKSNNRWMRRASAVSLIIPARKGQFLKEIFELADILLLDKDDLVQKGYGWMLKSCSQAHQKQVFDYVLKNKALMPRTALRHAIEKMPKDMRLKAMEKNIKGELK